MEAAAQNVFLIWLGALIAPPLLFGIWMRVKLMFTDQGNEFLVDREVAKTDAEYNTPYHRREEFGEMRGKVARAGKDFEALYGSYGNDVASLLKLAVPFIIGYGAYAAVLAGIGYFWVF